MQLSTAVRGGSLARQQLSKLGWREGRRLLCSETSPPPASEEELERRNPLGIQMLSRSLHRQLFRREWESTPDKSAVARSKEHLKAQGLWGKKGTTLPYTSITLPQMLGRNLDEHFRAIARRQTQPYLDLATGLVRARLRPLPAKWSSRPGWTRYDPVSGRPEGGWVGPPGDDALVLDVETCVREGEKPVLAVAVSLEAWYSWTSRRLSSTEEDLDSDLEEGRRVTLDELIPIESDTHKSGAQASESESWRRPRLIVGHNVSYDRARLREQYYLKVSQTKVCSQNNKRC